MTVGAICRSEENITRELSFEEILLDETLVGGDIWITGEALRNAGGINYRLSAKRNYELLLRVAKQSTILRVGSQNAEEYLSAGAEKEDWIHLKQEKETDGDDIASGIKTDCYLIGRYKAELLAMGCFDDAVLGIVSAGGEDATRYLERMIAGTEDFYDIYDCTQPILIYVGGDLCYNVLDTFARCLGRELEKLGQHVIYFDVSAQKMEDIVLYAGKRLKAVVGMQTYMFSVRKKDGTFIHDEIASQKYNFVFDHPIWLRHHLTQVPDGLTVLTPDGNYAGFVQRYYGHHARFFPPAGQESFLGKQKRRYDISFLGTYGAGVLEELKQLRRHDRKKAYMINRYVIYLRKYINNPPENAFDKMLDYYGIHYEKDEWMEQFHGVRWVALKLSYYYRNKVVETLLEAGLSLHVFGDSWKNSPLKTYPGLLCHEEAVGEQALAVYGDSRLSLNIMTWHKDGFTERIANAMLQKSVVVTDRTTYLDRNFVNDEELLTFDLRHMKNLPGRIRTLLMDEEKRAQIAERAYQKAAENHTWHRRAEEFLTLMEEGRKN